jgi:hypothetical protein
MTHGPLSPYARKTWIPVVTLGLVVSGCLLTLSPVLGLVSAIILGVTLVFLLEPGSGRVPQPRDAPLLARQAEWEAGWGPTPRTPDAPARAEQAAAAH